jgi:ethanolamine transporter
MSIIGTVVISIVMLCAVAGALASLRDDEKGLGKEFLEGLHAIGYIFIPVAGIMASIPFLSQLVQVVFGPTFAAIGADPAMAATSIIAVDMGGYQLADRLALTRESWIQAMLTGYMAGATIVFSIPVGLSLLEKRDHKYMALGIMSGLLSIPVGIFVSCLLMMWLQPSIRTVVATNAATDYTLHMSLATILQNLVPLVAMVTLLALGLRFVPDVMIRGFMIFGRIMNTLIILVLVASIVQYFTRIFYGEGLFTLLFGSWEFDPIIADLDEIEKSINARKGVEAEQVTRALEVAGYIGIMLAGAFPMVYLIKKFLARPMEKIGAKLGLGAAGAAGILAASANILAMFRLIREMKPKDKVINIAFAVCSAFLFGDHLAFTANFQPNLLIPVMAGKLTGGVFAVFLAYRLSVPKALQLERLEAALVPPNGQPATFPEMVPITIGSP